MNDKKQTQIWIDADACPVVIKDILFKAADRTQTQTTLVANHALNLPPSRYLSFIQVSAGLMWLTMKLLSA